MISQLPIHAYNIRCSCYVYQGFAHLFYTKKDCTKSWPLFFDSVAFSCIVILLVERYRYYVPEMCVVITDQDRKIFVAR